VLERVSWLSGSGVLPAFVRVTVARFWLRLKQPPPNPPVEHEPVSPGSPSGKVPKLIELLVPDHENVTLNVAAGAL